MKLKYYLRGLGIGIIVTAIIMSFTRQPEKLTDAQIKMRALELGMVEENVLADLQKEEVSEDEKLSLDDALIAGGEALIGEDIEMEENSEEEDLPQIEEDMSQIEEDLPQIEEDMSQIEENGVENNSVDVSQAEVVENYVIITVEGGNGSEVVSRRLHEAGLVDSALAYNQFLIDNGYSRILKVGNHEIPVGATEEEMAKILCGIE